MARKRISEEDLLNFRKQAGELAKVVEEKYNRMDEKRRAEMEAAPEPTGEWGLLLIHDAAEEASQLAGFAAKLCRRGMVSENVDLTSYIPTDRFDKTPLWQKWLTVAQLSYQRLTERCEKVIVLGTGLSAPIACVIAEQYPVDGLAIIGGGLKKEGLCLKNGGVKGTSFQLARLAKNNLFSIVCPVLALVPENCAPYTAQSADMYRIATRSESIRTERFPGTNPSDIWTKCEESLLDAIQGFFTGD